MGGVLQHAGAAASDASVGPTCRVVPVVGDCNVPLCLGSFASILGVSKGPLEAHQRKLAHDKAQVLIGEVGCPINPPPSHTHTHTQPPFESNYMHNSSRDLSCQSHLY